MCECSIGISCNQRACAVVSRPFSSPYQFTQVHLIHVQLNNAQRTAVEAADGPVLVLAGAGSGKTRVIVERIRWLVEERGIDPRQILALTFTNKAATEMKNRVARALDVDRLASFMGTFHSFGLSVLRRDMEALGYSKTFTVFDDGDQLTLMKRLIKALPESFASVSPREALSWISRHKSQLSTPEAESNSSPEERTFAELWSRYAKALEASAAIDFDDLLGLPVWLFREHEDIRSRYTNRYRYVLVDEYQDTNHAQYELLQHLAGDAHNVFVVGDEDQAIYSWRGADIRNILEFEKDFPDAQVVRLEENYRSTQPILAAANAVVSQNTERLGKTLRSTQSGGEVPSFEILEDARAEAEHIIDTIKSRKYPVGEVAVLFRTNGQARSLEEAFLRKGLAYRTVGLVRFYARQEIKHLLCYLRLAVNPGDDEAVNRVVNIPARGIGDVSLSRVRQAADAAESTLYKSLRDYAEDPEAPGRLRNGAAEFCDVVAQLSERSLTESVGDTVVWLLDKLGYEEWLQHAYPEDYRTRIEHVEEFVDACREFDDGGGKGLSTFLHDLALDSEVNQPEALGGAVTLLTCHSAKGLEFDHVFVVGLEEGLLPHGASMDDPAKIEEERRLFYVAMTRARKSLNLSAAKYRMTHGETLPKTTSRFVESIPAGLISAAEDAASTQRKAPPIARRADADGLKMGTRVRHAKFGLGTVMFSSGSGSSAKVKIRFDRGGAKQFLVRATPLEIVKGPRR